MDYQTIKMIMKINESKNIGNVIFIVEGGRNEFSLLQYILTKIFNYAYIEKRRHKIDFYEKKNCNSISLSNIAVVNTETSNISSILDKNNFLNDTLQRLAFEYGFDIDNSAIFYIFDRDPHSNIDTKLIEAFITNMADPYDNGAERGGLLLLSYPAIESYIISSFMDNTYLTEFELGHEIKTFIDESKGQFSLNKMNALTVLKAADEMIKFIKLVDNNFNIDKFSETNKLLYEEHEKHYLKYKKYQLLSLLSFAFIYLGLLEMD